MLPGRTHNRISRRSFLATTAGTVAAGRVALEAWNPFVASAAEAAEQKHGPVRVSDIEVHNITVPYRDWLAYPLNHYYGPSHRTVYVVHTSNGFIGLGESGSPEPEDVIEQYIGTNPFDWVGDETSLGLGTAMYDLMGKAAGVPVYKLIGQRYRRLIPVGCWTVSTDPKHMAETVTRYAADGYTWLKYHLSPFENVFDQLEAMQAVAPQGFRVMFDLTMGGTNDHIPDLVQKMAEFPISGAFEDPLHSRDIEGYVELRKRAPLPIVLHHGPLGHTFEIMRRSADAYILGHSRIGQAIRTAGLMAAANVPFMLQNVGGMITRTMTTHMHASLKTASHPFHSDAETWSDDVVHERLEPVNGLLRVPEKPGLGLTLDREALERLKNLSLPEQDRWILRTRFANGTMMYNIANPRNSIFMVRPDHRRLAPMSYCAPLSTDYWDDDGTEEYRTMFAKIEKEGIVLVRG